MKQEVSDMANAAQNSRIILTYEDYLKLPNDRNRYEILEGALIVTPAPTPFHQKVSRNLEFLLFSHIRKHKSGEILNAPIDVIFNEITVVQPDLVYLSREKGGILTGRGIEGAPDLIVEILSSSSLKYDRVSKFHAYARHGVEWYWIVNPDERTIEEYRLEEDQYKLSGAFVGSHKFRPGLFPDLEIDLSEVWD